MPNLVGIGNSQVPTNAMLGGLAYQDSVGEIDIDKIKARSSDTAVDIFVYDTRKDSDGGAWRHRTQNTSWYNEGASATRGSRKEFPAVAVIVATDGIYTIYDGDDPNLPMWMVFEHDSNSGARIARQGTSAITMMNGLMCAVRSGSQRAAGFASFIDDTGYQINNVGKYLAIGGWDGLVNRNVTGSFTLTDTSTTIVGNGTIYDVAVTVLPNAPIDTDTGLPIPTFAFATNGGTGILKDDGTSTLYTNIETRHVDIHPDGFMIDGVTGAVNDNFSLFDIANTTRVTVYDARAGVSAINTFLNQATGECVFEGNSNEIAIAQTLGLLRVEEEIDDYANGLHNKTTSSYTTGWMVGDTKGVFLSDIDTTSTAGIAVTGTEYVTNGDFNNGLSGWTQVIGTGGSISVNGSTQVVITSQGGGGSPTYTELRQDVTVPKGVDLIYSFDLISGSIYNGGFASNNLSAGTYQWVFNLPGTGTQTINLWFTPPGWMGSNRILDNISIRTAERDRSVHGGFITHTGNNQSEKHGLRLYGTVNKRRVAVGSQLVGYNFPAASSYLHQPYTPEIGNVGTGNFCIMGWFYKTPRGITFFDIAQAAAPRFFVAQMYNSDNFWFYINTSSGGHSWNPLPSGGVENKSGWQFIAVKIVGTTLSYSFNGADFVEQVNDAWGGDISSSAPHPFVTLGQNYTHNSAHFGNNGMMSLWKFSHSVPNNEQIIKIYNDEKKLFNENAKCTLNGTSDDVKALAYDDTTDVLHVGTSGGRSDFRGLNRINNTTTAVTTAISASNELVAEQ